MTTNTEFTVEKVYKKALMKSLLLPILRHKCSIFKR